MVIKVVHCKKVNNHEYIGRPSPLGNPYTMKTEGERSEVIRKYQVWINKKIKERDKEVMKELQRLLKIAMGGDLNIGCWCAPKECHGDVVKEILERAIEKKTKRKVL